MLLAEGRAEDHSRRGGRTVWDVELREDSTAVEPRRCDRHRVDPVAVVRVLIALSSLVMAQRLIVYSSGRVAWLSGCGRVRDSAIESRAPPIDSMLVDVARSSSSSG